MNGQRDAVHDPDDRVGDRVDLLGMEGLAGEPLDQRTNVVERERMRRHAPTMILSELNYQHVLRGSLRTSIVVTSTAMTLLVGVGRRSTIIDPSFELLASPRRVR